MRYEEGEKLLYVYSKIYTRTGTDSIILYIYIFLCIPYRERERLRDALLFVGISLLSAPDVARQLVNLWGTFD